MSENFASGTVPLPSDTIRVLEEKILLALDALSGGGGGGGLGTGQIKQYTADPNAEAVVPDNQSFPAIAYQLGGAGNTMTWNTTTHVWQ